MQSNEDISVKQEMKNSSEMKILLLNFSNNKFDTVWIFDQPFVNRSYKGGGRYLKLYFTYVIFWYELFALSNNFWDELCNIIRSML